MKRLVAAVAWMVLKVAVVSAGPLPFSDGFEGAALDPFWTATAQSGSIALPSSAMVHSGLHSLQLDSTATAANKYIALEHVFSQPVYGRFSVWIYDTGADAFSSNYIDFYLGRLGTHDRASIFGRDYDLGPSNGGTYSINPNDQDTIATGVDRTAAWHQFLIDISPARTIYQIDGATVFTKDSVPMDHVVLYMGGPWWRPAWTSYFDDFSFTPFAANSVPEPGTVGLVGLGMAALVMWRRRRGRSRR